MWVWFGERGRVPGLILFLRTRKPGIVDRDREAKRMVDSSLREVRGGPKRAGRTKVSHGSWSKGSGSLI